MGHRRIKRALLLSACAALLATSVGGAEAALVKVGSLVLRADGRFVPSALPHNRYAPIDFRGQANLTDTKGATPTALEEMRLDFDRNGKFETQGLGVCPVRRIANSTVAGARRRCAKAIVGTGHVGAIYDLFGLAAELRVRGTLFNGPRVNGNPTVVGHTFTILPTTRAYTVVIPIRRLTGAFKYRATVDVPTLAGGGVLTHIDGRIGRRYKQGGRKRSYVRARCRSGVLRTHGHFLFADGTIIDGSLEKACTQKPLP
jgi:hypothetical protein